MYDRVSRNSRLVHVQPPYNFITRRIHITQYTYERPKYDEFIVFMCDFNGFDVNVAYLLASRVTETKKSGDSHAA